MAGPLAGFGLVRERLGVSAPVLSKHVTVLVEAGYLAQRKAVRDTRRRVWLRLTPEGHRAYRAHIAALQTIITSTPPTTPLSPPTTTTHP